MRYLIFFLVVLCGCMPAASHQKMPTRTVTVLADSISGFSGTQGTNGWFYGYWDRTADADKQYSPKTDFQLIGHFGGDPINGLSSHPDFTTGKLWVLKDGQYRTSIWAEGGCSNGTTRLSTQAKVEHWTIRRWVSTVNGPILISGQVAKILPWGSTDSGRVHIIVDGASIFSNPLDASKEVGPNAPYIGGMNYSVDATVRIGSTVDLIISPAATENGGFYGPVKFTATIQTRS
jgi:hypothetical protein